MTQLIRWQDEHRLLPILLVFSLMLLGLCAAIAWPRGTGDGAPGRDLRAAYGRAALGASRPQLAALGFDAAAPGVRHLTGLGVQEYFMPRSSRDFDRLDPAVQDCFESPDRCNVLLFPLQGRRDAGGLFAAHAAPRAPGQVILLLRSGRLTYKAIDGA